VKVSGRFLAVFDGFWHKMNEKLRFYRDKVKLLAGKFVQGDEISGESLVVIKLFFDYDLFK